MSGATVQTVSFDSVLRSTPGWMDTVMKRVLRHHDPSCRACVQAWSAQYQRYMLYCSDNSVSLL